MDHIKRITKSKSLAAKLNEKGTLTAKQVKALAKMTSKERKAIADELEGESDTEQPAEHSANITYPKVPSLEEAFPPEQSEHKERTTQNKIRETLKQQDAI